MRKLDYTNYIQFLINQTEVSIHIKRQKKNKDTNFLQVYKFLPFLYLLNIFFSNHKRSNLPELWEGADNNFY